MKRTPGAGRAAVLLARVLAVVTDDGAGRGDAWERRGDVGRGNGGVTCVGRREAKVGVIVRRCD